MLTINTTIWMTNKRTKHHTFFAFACSGYNSFGWCFWFIISSSFRGGLGGYSRVYYPESSFRRRMNDPPDTTYICRLLSGWAICAWKHAPYSHKIARPTAQQPMARSIWNGSVELNYKPWALLAVFYFRLFVFFFIETHIIYSKHIFSANSSECEKNPFSSAPIHLFHPPSCTIRNWIKSVLSALHTT